MKRVKRLFSTLPILCFSSLVSCSFFSALSANTTDSSPEKKPLSSFSYHSFVNWDYRHRNKLKGWLATSWVIKKTMEQRFGSLSTSHYENQSPETLLQFLKTLPSSSPSSQVSLVYLASHQSPEGKWDFVQKQKESWQTLLQNTSIPSHPNRIVIMDSCFASSVLHFPEWQTQWRSLSFFSSSANEYANELTIFKRRPVDYRLRFRREYDWLKLHMPKTWKGELSFFGLIWLQTWLDIEEGKFLSQHNGSKAHWIQFFKQCQKHALAFKKKRHPKLASSLILDH